MIDAKSLRELIEYSPETGEFRWAKNRRGCRVGDICGRISVHGYREICVSGRLYRANRLAFLYMTGAWPIAEIDHINRNKSDDRWSNLRQASRSQNMANVGLRADNTSSFPGVVWDKQRSKWRAQIRIGGRKVNLGRFPTFEEAKLVVQAAAKSQWQEFAQWAA